MNSKHNKALDGYRGIFALIVVSCHFYHPRYLINAHLSVEYFFILSGFLLIYKFNPAVNPIRFLYNKFIQLFPLCFFMLVVYYIKAMIVTPRATKDMIAKLPSLFYEGLFLHVFGLPTAKLYINAAYWYISVLLTSSFLIYGLFYYYKEKFLKLFAPIIILFSYTLLIHNYGNLIDFREPAAGGLMIKGLLRGVGDMSVGVLLYCLVQKLDRIYDIYKLKKSPAFKLVSIGVEAVLLLSIITLFTYSITPDADFLIIPFFCLLVILSWFNIGVCCKVANTSILQWLGGLSLYIYIGHSICFTYIKQFSMEYLHDIGYLHDYIEWGLLLLSSISIASLLKYIIHPFINLAVTLIQKNLNRYKM